MDTARFQSSIGFPSPLLYLMSMGLSRSSFLVGFTYMQASLPVELSFCSNAAHLGLTCHPPTHAHVCTGPGGGGMGAHAVQGPSGGGPAQGGRD